MDQECKRKEIDPYVCEQTIAGEKNKVSDMGEIKTPIIHADLLWHLNKSHKHTYVNFKISIVCTKFT